MEKIIKLILVLLAFGLYMPVVAQSERSAKSSSVKGSIVQPEQTALPNGPKAEFVNEKKYLLPASNSGLTKDKSFSSDSLKGYNEAATQNYLLANRISGSEHFGYINKSKRKFINQKYKIGQYAPKPDAAPVNGNRPIGGGGNVINILPCVNEDFELTPPGAYNTAFAVSGWTIESDPGPLPGASCGAAFSWVGGSPEFSIVSTPVLATPYGGGVFSIDNVIIPNSPLGGTNVARLNDSSPDGLITKISQTFPVTNANTLFQFAYMGSWDGAHDCCDQPFVQIGLYNCPGQPLTCSSVSFVPSSPQCTLNTAVTYSLMGTSYYYTGNWYVNYIDLTPFVGTCITIEVLSGDCGFGGHHGSLYFDARCGGQLAPGADAPGGNGGQVGGPVSFCSGANIATIQAPMGYSTYQWIAPGTPTTQVPPINGGNTPTLTINNPVPGTVYTVQLVTASGCSYTAVDTLAFSSVNIVGTSTAPTCPGGASGGATVFGNGSGAGYTYTWTTLTGTVLGNNATVGGLATGIYSVTIEAFGGGCGTAGTTVQVVTGPPPTQTVIIPFCGAEAYLGTPGSNHQWYNNTVPIPANQGGTASSYTVAGPVHGQIVRLGYQTIQGCRDSVTYILSQSPSGSMYATNIYSACPATPNGSASIVMVPAQGAPPGAISYSVVSITPNVPYSAWLPSTSQTMYNMSNLPPATYSVIGFDGACKYTNTFVVDPYYWDFAVTPGATTLCPGGSVLASVSFTMPIVPGQFSYLWSPNQYMAPGNNDIAVILNPSSPMGSITPYVYSVTVNPAIVNCPKTKTISVIAANLAVPNITSFSPFCTNAAPKTISVSAPGGTFTANQPGGWLNNGVITPATFTQPGNYSFQYAISYGTCQVSNSSNFDVLRFNSAALSASIANMCVTNPCVNLMGIVGSTVNGTWGGLGVGSNTFCPSSVQGGLITLTYSTTSTPPNPGLCNDTRTINVSVSNTVAPFITPVDPFCTNKAPQQLFASPPGGTWSYVGPPPAGQVIGPVSGILTFANVPLGNSSIVYSLPTGACINVASTALVATLYRSPAITGSIPDMCFYGPSFNLMSIVANTVSGVWQGYGVNSLNSTFTPSNIVNPNNPGVTGSYTLTYRTFSFPNPDVCKDSSKVVVNVLKPVNPTITPVPAHCIADAPFQLFATPNTGVFTSSPYVDANGMFNPALSAVGNNQIEYIVGTPNCNIADVKYVSIEAFVPATLTGSISDQCSTNSLINLNGLVQNNSGSWTGPGIQGSTFDPATSGTGQLTITYKTASSPSGLCPDQRSLSVNVFSLATPVISDQGALCNSMEPVQLIVTPLGGTFEGDNNEAITPGGLFNPGYGVIGDNIITYSVSSGPCKAITKATVKIEQFVSADFLTYAKEFCRNDAPFDMSSLSINKGGEWSGDGMDGSLFVPANANVGNNNRIIYKTFSSPTQSLCPDTSMMKVNINDLPNVSVVVNKQKGCAPVEVMLNSPDASNTGEGTWYLGDGTEPVHGLSITHTYPTPGTYSVVFNYRDQIGCVGQALLKEPIVVHEIPTAEFTYGPYQEITITEPEVQFQNQTTVLGNNTYMWQIGSLYQLPDVNPTVVFPAIGKYEVTLTATSIHGCKDKVSHVIEIKNDFGVYIPTSFTPNDDGLNDVFGPVFSPYGLDANSFDMEIFDRWGHSLYHTKDVTKGWNGSIQNKGTEPMKTDVYVYKIKYRDMDGVVYSKLGHVSIMR